MDIALIMLIVATSGYAGLMTALRNRSEQSLMTGLVAFGAFVAAFFAAVGLANIAYLAMVALVMTLTAAGTYLAVRADLGARRAGGLALGATLIVTAASLFVSYLAPMAYVLTVSTYQLLRLFVPTRPALMLMSAAFGGLLVMAGAVFYVGLASM